MRRRNLLIGLGAVSLALSLPLVGSAEPCKPNTTNNPKCQPTGQPPPPPPAPNQPPPPPASPTPPPASPAPGDPGPNLPPGEDGPTTPPPAQEKPNKSAKIGFRAFLAGSLAADARQNPHKTFRVIVQGKSTEFVARTVAEDGANELRLDSIGAVAVDLTGAELLELPGQKGIGAVSLDAPVVLTETATAPSTLQDWPLVSGVEALWKAPKGKLPTIAIVDSGVDTRSPDLAGQVVAQVRLTKLAQNSPGDGRGHGTMVAGIAAGSAPGYAGAAPGARIVSLDVIDDTGMGLTSDVIRAAEWILKNQKRYGIKVANFSLHSSVASSLAFDPLNEAVEKLWLAGVVVVTSAGNYAVDGAESGVLFAPANDPFVITVGALDTLDSLDTDDDVAAPWSAFGYTLDGFAKPELAAPGRYMVGPVPAGSTLAAERAENLVAPGYLQISGTSFAAPVVSGAAATLLALHPRWTPDQVKGALMLTARGLPGATGLSAGVGEIDAVAAAALSRPPNPNRALNAYVVLDVRRQVRAFHANRWADAARADAAWANAAWANAAWANAAWANAAWANAAWANAAWANAAWANAAWANAAWANAAWANAAGDEARPAGPYVK